MQRGFQRRVGAVGLVGFLAVSGASSVVVGGCGGGAGAERPRAADLARLPEGVVRVSPEGMKFVTVQTIGAQRGFSVLNFPARVDFRDDALSDVGAPVAGRVMELKVQLGQHVNVGDALVTLRSPDAAGARAGLVAAIASLRAARATAARVDRMLEQGVATEREKIEADARVAELEAEVARAQSSTSFVGRGAGGDVTVRAPISGTVITRNATIGAMFEPNGAPILQIGDPTSLWVEADVFERDVPLVHEGATASVKLQTNEHPLPARVVSVGSVVSTGLRTAPVRIAFDEAVDTRVLRAGMFGSVTVNASEEGVSLPTEAVLIRDGDHYVVYVQRDDGLFERRSVQVGQAIDGHVQVISGIRQGDRVVVAGALLLDGEADQLI